MISLVLITTLGALPANVGHKGSACSLSMVDMVVIQAEAMPGFMALPMITPGPGSRAAVHLAP